MAVDSSPTQKSSSVTPTHTQSLASVSHSKCGNNGRDTSAKNKENESATESARSADSVVPAETAESPPVVAKKRKRLVPSFPIAGGRIVDDESKDVWVVSVCCDSSGTLYGQAKDTTMWYVLYSTAEMNASQMEAVRRANHEPSAHPHSCTIPSMPLSCSTLPLALIDPEPTLSASQFRHHLPMQVRSCHTSSSGNSCLRGHCRCHYRGQCSRYGIGTVDRPPRWPFDPCMRQC